MDQQLTGISITVLQLKFEKYDDRISLHVVTLCIHYVHVHVYSDTVEYQDGGHTMTGTCE